MMLLKLCILLGVLGSVESSVRATWLTTYDQQLKSVDSLRQLFSDFQSLGVNKVYIDVWNSGNLYAKSSTYENLFGTIPNDYLGNALEAAEGFGMSVVAWFEYGNLATYGGVSGSFANYAKEKGWLINGGYSIYEGFTWCDPGNPEYADFLVAMVSDVMNSYKSYQHFMGVQFDDHLAYPTALPYTSYTHDRAGAVDGLIQRISQAVGASYFSIAPMVMPQSRDKHSANWPEWVNNYWVYEAVPQVYYDNYSSFTSVLDQQLAYISQEKLTAGIRCNGSGSATEFGVIAEMIQYSEHRNVKGVSVWYGNCLYDLYKEEFEGFWGDNGEAF